ncbi:MAG: hypothetical protein RSA20_02580 [Oscillospiraceae bacterium]
MWYNNLTGGVPTATALRTVPRKADAFTVRTFEIRSNKPQKFRTNHRRIFRIHL